MSVKIPDEHAVGLAQLLIEAWESGDNGALDGYEVQRALLLDTVLTARSSVAAEEGKATVGGDAEDARKFLPMFAREGQDGDEQVCEYDDEKGRALVKRAQEGDADADAVLCGIAARFISGGTKMPEFLNWYIFYVLMTRRDAPPPRPARHAKMGRNVNIVLVVDALQKFGFRPTRNRVTHAQRSGCSIMAEALSKRGFPISEAGVEEVWRDRARFTVRD